MKTKNWDLAIERWSQFLNKFPQDFWLLVGKGNALLNLDKISKAEMVFKEIIAKYPDKLQGYEGLANIAMKTENWDLALLIYIDGSHQSQDVLLDALLCWQLLKVGGLMIFDDYKWKRYQEEILNPQSGIDAFLSVFKSYLEIMQQNYQVIIKKIGEIPESGHLAN